MTQSLRHLAVIMDGNRRWARAQGRPEWEGHEEGLEALRRASMACQQLGITYLTVYAFSTENWKRTEIEKQALFRLIENYAKQELPTFHRDHVRFRAIGELDRFPKGVQESIRHLMEETKHYEEHHLTALLNYGARADLTNAVQRIANSATEQASAGPLKVTEDMIASALSTAGLPDPDLMVRTGGQMRLSNFLLWEVAYTEFLFDPAFWPEVTAEHVQRWKDEFDQRQRNFGK